MMTESDISPASARLRLAHLDRSMQTTGSWWSHRVSQVLKLQGAWACVLEGTRDLQRCLGRASCKQTNNGVFERMNEGSRA